MPDDAPNEIYLSTLKGLSGMVSPVAAERMVSASVRDAGFNPATVSASQMRTLLLGPVQFELEQILPRRMLQRDLGALAERLALLPQPPQSPALSTSSRVTPAQIAKIRTARVISGVRVKPPVQQENSDAELQEAVLKLAMIAEVTLVAAVRRNFEPVFWRGQGDVVQLARYGGLAMQLLIRSSPLKMFYVAKEDSMLILFPWGSDTLLLAAGSEVNIGAVVAAFTDIAKAKEES